MRILFREHPHILEAFSNLLDAIIAEHPTLKGIASYKMIEARYDCQLIYNVEVRSGACFGVEISEEMLALILLKYSKASSVPK